MSVLFHCTVATKTKLQSFSSHVRFNVSSLSDISLQFETILWWRHYLSPANNDIKISSKQSCLDQCTNMKNRRIFHFFSSAIYRMKICVTSVDVCVGRFVTHLQLFKSTCIYYTTNADISVCRLCWKWVIYLPLTESLILDEVCRVLCYNFSILKTLNRNSTKLFILSF